MEEFAMRGIFVLALALGLVGAKSELAAQQPLPADIVAAWHKAGARAGWLGPGKNGYLVFHAGEHGKEGEVPAFELPETWQPGVTGKLPQPGQ